jgi:hypothetical protein
MTSIRSLLLLRLLLLLLIRLLQRMIYSFTSRRVVTNVKRLTSTSEVACDSIRYFILPSLRRPSE